MIRRHLLVSLISLQRVGFGLEPPGQGQDVFAQTVVGARMTLLLGLGVGVATTILEAIGGISAGYFGGRIDDLLSS